MRILGLSAYYHDSAAALVEDGRVVSAAQEERFTRKKHDPGFPINAVRFCLEEIDPGSVDAVVFYDKPFLKFERLLETYLAFAPNGFRSFRLAFPLWIKEKLFQRSTLADELKQVSDNVDWPARLLLSVAFRSRGSAHHGRSG
jgi:carbamoyltransferase